MIRHCNSSNNSIVFLTVKECFTELLAFINILNRIGPVKPAIQVTSFKAPKDRAEVKSQENRWSVEGLVRRAVNCYSLIVIR